MRKRMTGKWVAIAAAAALVIGGAALPAGAAEDVTPASLAEGVNEKMEAVDSYAAGLNFDMNMDFFIEGQGMTLDMGMIMNMNMNMESTADPQAAHVKGSINMSMRMGDEESPMEDETFESYVVQEDGVTAAYSTGDGGETWETGEGEFDEEEIRNMISQMSFFQGIADGEVEAELAGTDEYNGQEVYVVNATLTGEYLQEAMNAGTGGEAESMFGDLDPSQFQAPAEILFYTENQLPARVSIDMTEMGKAMIEAAMGLSEEDLEGMELTVDVNAFGMEISYSDYGTVAEITVPDEVRAAAVEGDVEEPELLDGEEIGEEIEEQIEEQTEQAADVG